MSLHTKNNTCRDAFDIKKQLQVFKNELVKEFKRSKQTFFVEINSFKK